MRGNVLYRTGRYGEGEQTYLDALERSTAMQEVRGRALARIGLLKGRAKLGAEEEAVDREFLGSRAWLEERGMRHLTDLVERAREEVGLSRRGMT